MSIENLLSRLEKVKRRSNNQWMACCPVHQEKTPSLSIKDDNGTIIMKCFGCDASGLDVIYALGMEPSDLFPPSDNVDYKSRPKRSKFPADQVLEALITEATVIYMIASDMSKTDNIDQETKDRLLQAAGRVNAAANYTRINT